MVCGQGVVSSVQNYASKLQSFFSREVEENFQQRMREEQQNKGSTDQSLIVVMNEKVLPCERTPQLGELSVQGIGAIADGGGNGSVPVVCCAQQR